MLLQALIKETPESHIDFQKLSQAATEIKNVILTINQTKKGEQASEEMNKLLENQKKISKTKSKLHSTPDQKRKSDTKKDSHNHKEAHNENDEHDEHKSGKLQVDIFKCRILIKNDKTTAPYISVNVKAGDSTFKTKK